MEARAVRGLRTETEARVRSFEVPCSSGALLVHAEYPEGRVFPKHFHEHYLAVVTEAGSHRVWFRGKTYEPGPEDVVLLNPGEVHTGESPGRPWSYRALLLRSSHLARHRMGAPSPGELAFPVPVLRSARLAARIRAAHETLKLATGLEADVILHQVVAELAHVEGSGHRVPEPVWDARFHPGLRRAVEKLHSSYEEVVGLEELARIADLSRSYFARAFKAAMGVPPHTYQIRLRMLRAEELLRSSGDSLTEIALLLGFSHQSHFTNSFRRFYGVSPGRYRRMHGRRPDNG